MNPSIDAYEKLGAFYLGREYDLDAKSLGDLVLYDSKDLVTHAVCVGMTGSGKTGLCVGLIEEAAIDGIPSIVIDPKGDLANLMLTFPALLPEDFRPWINLDDARRKELTPDAFAEKQAALWRSGLAEWGQPPERIRRLRDAAEFTIYTPGSSAGVQVSMLRSFDAPEPGIVADRDLFHEHLNSTVATLLGLVGISGDPLRSREHILLSNILSESWSRGRDLDLGDLIQRVQTPPFERVGVMDLEAFYPASDRTGLAMQLNSVLASPSFAAWIEGVPLDIQSILYTPEGKPRVAIFSIAHLNDAERMFFVASLLNHVLSWTRRQPGTTSLRALVYMDEIAGYCPPVANVPSKQPLMTLMKQARAFGVGVVLATQNPVDLDYKGLSNAGTWFIGRLQTDRDKARVLDGLEGAAAASAAKFDRQQIDQMLSRLGSRVFLLNNVHDDAPTLFQTRWVMSYLAGPLTRDQIRAVAAPHKQPAEAAPPPAEPAHAAAPPSPPPAAEATRTRPVLPAGIPEYFVPPILTARGGRLRYEPMLLGQASVYYSESRMNVDLEETVSYLAPITDGPIPVDWSAAVESALTDRDVESTPVPGAAFNPLPPDAAQARSYGKWQKDLADVIYRARRLELLRSAEFKVCSAIGEAERDFRVRLQQLAREARDAEVEKLRRKYAPKSASLEEKLRRAEQALDVQKEQSRDAKTSMVVSIGSALLSAFLGKKKVNAGTISKAGTAARGASRSMREASDVERAEQTIEAVRKQLAELEAQFQADLAALESTLAARHEALEPVTVRPKKTNIKVQAVLLTWMPYVDANGRAEPAWEN